MMMDADRPAPHHPYRGHLKSELDALSEEVLRFLDEGHEMPIGEEVIEAAAERTAIRMALDLSVRDRRRVQAWLLRRHLKKIKVKPRNTDSGTTSNTA